MTGNLATDCTRSTPHRCADQAGLFRARAQVITHGGVAALFCASGAWFDEQVLAKAAGAIRFHFRTAPSVIAFIAITTSVYIAQRTLGNPTATFDDVWRLLGFSTPDIAEGEVWRLYTANLVHTLDGPGPRGMSHLAGNMAALALLGPPLERRVGNRGFVGVYVAGGVIAYCSVVPFDLYAEWAGGASGSTYAVLGALTAWAAVHRVSSRAAWRLRVAMIALVPLLIARNLWLLDDQVTRVIHTGGFVAGAVLVVLLAPNPQLRRLRVALAVLLTLGVAVASIAETRTSAARSVPPTDPAFLPSSDPLRDLSSAAETASFCIRVPDTTDKYRIADVHMAVHELPGTETATSLAVRYETEDDEFAFQVWQTDLAPRLQGESDPASPSSGQAVEIAGTMWIEIHQSPPLVSLGHRFDDGVTLAVASARPRSLLIAIASSLVNRRPGIGDCP